MRYYHYGHRSSSSGMPVKNDVAALESELYGSRLTTGDKDKGEYKSSLIIDDDTVYEIDEECINCRNSYK